MINAISSGRPEPAGFQSAPFFFPKTRSILLSLRRTNLSAFNPLMVVTPVSGLLVEWPSSAEVGSTKFCQDTTSPLALAVMVSVADASTHIVIGALNILLLLPAPLETIEPSGCLEPPFIQADTEKSVPASNISSASPVGIST